MEAVTKLQRYDSFPTAAVPALTDLMLRTQDSNLNGRIQLLLGDLGPKAKEAIPAIKVKIVELDRLKKLADAKQLDPAEMDRLRQRPFRSQLVSLLKIIEGDAK